jgi:serine/threonine protein kinase
MNQEPEGTGAAPEEDPRLLRAAQEYLAALESGRPIDRREYLARFPDLAPELAVYLEALDMVHGTAPMLRSDVPQEPRPAVEESLPAEPLGDFRIVREIGRGGMGVVYEAVQRSLGRRVALKVLPFAAALDARQLQRFQNEAQAAAQLHHTNIVPVYFVGCERGVHFYAMQLIEGQNLAALVESLRGLRAPSMTDAGAGQEQGSPDAFPHPLTPRDPPSGNPDTALGAQLSTQRSDRPREFFRTLAQLVVQAAEALEYAHTMGVIHRDIKPANLLVDHRGAVWVTDFGLAQFHAETHLTHSGELLGTLRYMSPEQAGGRRALVDQRADVYSLGATLYELLTLRPIFDGTDRQTLLYQILHEEPPAPRSIDRAVPPELETIVQKAIGKTPAERYSTAQEFADDLKRFLDDRPIHARRPSLVEKATKWARRHRGVVVSAVAALLLLVAGLSVATALTARAYERANQQRAQAEESFRQARKVVDQFTQISAEELAGNPFLEGPRKRLLEVALGYYQDFLDQHRDDPSLQKALEASRARVEGIISELTTLMGAGQYGLLHEPAVQEALQLTPEQKAFLARMNAHWQSAFHETHGRPPKERERKFLELAQEQETEVPKLLDPRQMKRFKQIALQDRGPRAFADSAVTTELGLTPSQKEQILKILDEQDPFMMKFGSPGPPPQPKRGGKRGDRPPPGEGRAGMMPRPDQQLKDCEDKVLNLLNAAQRQKWQDMVGEPIPGGIRRGPPGFGQR